ncbi:MAG: hypothetical protein U1E73_10050 [Planctomycetota bacterium]
MTTTSALKAIASIAVLVSALDAQNGTSPTLTGTPGGSITISVGSNDQTIQVCDPTTGDTQTSQVTPGKDTTVQLPNAPGGTVVEIRLGKGLDARIIFVELVSPGP